MREQVIRIKTHDTEKTYEFPKLGVANPQLWEVALYLSSVDSRGNIISGNTVRRRVYLERSTLEDAGLLPGLLSVTPRARGEDHEPVETAEDLIVRLLEIVDVYPTID